MSCEDEGFERPEYDPASLGHYPKGEREPLPPPNKVDAQRPMPAIVVYGFVALVVIVVPLLVLVSVFGG